MPSFGVVLDANVLINAGPRDTLLRAAERELYRPYWSEAILDEVQLGEQVSRGDAATPHTRPA